MEKGNKIISKSNQHRNKELDEIKTEKTKSTITISTIKNPYTIPTDINKHINSNDKTEDVTTNGNKHTKNIVTSTEDKYERLMQTGRHSNAQRYQQLTINGEHERAEQFYIDILREHFREEETQTTIQDAIINNETLTLPRHITTDTQHINEDKTLHDLPLTNNDDKPLNKKQIKQNKKAIKEENRKLRKNSVKPDKKVKVVHSLEKVTPNRLKEQGEKIIRTDEYITINDTKPQSTPQIQCGQPNQNTVIKPSEQTTIEIEKETKETKKWDDIVTNPQWENISDEEQIDKMTTRQYTQDNKTVNDNSQNESEHKQKGKDNENNNKKEQITAYLQQHDISDIVQQTNEKKSGSVGGRLSSKQKKGRMMKYCQSSSFTKRFESVMILIVARRIIRFSEALSLESPYK